VPLEEVTDSWIKRVDTTTHKAIKSTPGRP
jgi:hypothetical protein